MYGFGKRSRQSLDGVQPEVRELCEMALSISEVDFAVIDGFRTAKQQKEMYMSGASELDGVNRISDHQIGKAVDIIPYVKGIDIWAVHEPEVAVAWLEVYRAFMRASMKKKLVLEFGLGYNVGGGRDYPHIAVVGKLS